MGGILPLFSYFSTVSVETVGKPDKKWSGGSKSCSKLVNINRPTLVAIRYDLHSDVLNFVGLRRVRKQDPLLE